MRARRAWSNCTTSPGSTCSRSARRSASPGARSTATGATHAPSSPRAPTPDPAQRRRAPATTASMRDTFPPAQSPALRELFDSLIELPPDIREAKIVGLGLPAALGDRLRAMIVFDEIVALAPE